jgi:hypothetical protein
MPLSNFPNWSTGSDLINCGKGAITWGVWATKMCSPFWLISVDKTKSTIFGRWKATSPQSMRSFAMQTKTHEGDHARGCVDRTGRRPSSLGRQPDIDGTESH